ncbi:MAG: glycosyltransferase family 4 protein [Planctomycetes bacterium]|nr:glycosyltransferase family 4 protein [Planctomycetota bacterium]
MNPHHALLAERRIAFGAIGGTQGGPRTYAVELLRSWAAHPPAWKELLVLSDRPQVLVPERAPQWMRAQRLPLFHPALRPLAERFAIPRALRAAGCDLYHGTKNSLPRGLPCAAVTTIHDLAPFLQPETFSPLSGRYLRRAITTAVERAERVIAVSRTTARDLVEVLGVSADRIDVVYNGVSEALLRPAQPTEVRALRQRLGLDGPLVLCLGTVQPRKNQLAVLEAFLRAQPRLPANTTCLFVGRAGWQTKNFERAYARSAGRSLRWIRDFPDRDLRALYGAASLFVSPSSYEGFGITVVEAMAQGCPVIALDRGATPEVVGHAGELLPAPDPELLSEAMVRLLEDRSLRARYARWGRQRAAAFTWKSSAARHLASYARALGECNAVEGAVLDDAASPPAEAEGEAESIRALLATPARRRAGISR